MKCPNCGAEVPENVEYCYACGRRVEKGISYVDLPLGTIVNCPKCGTKNSRTDNRCRNCDHDLTEAKAAIVKSVTLGPQKLSSKCINCGSDNPVGVAFCGTCGSVIGERAIANETYVMNEVLKRVDRIASGVDFIVMIIIISIVLSIMSVIIGFLLTLGHI
jgi:uncharacterized membrane protein YvbJ